MTNIYLVKVSQIVDPSTGYVYEQPEQVHRTLSPVAKAGIAGAVAGGLTTAAFTQAERQERLSALRQKRSDRIGKWAQKANQHMQLAGGEFVPKSARDLHVSKANTAMGNAIRATEKAEALKNARVGAFSKPVLKSGLKGAVIGAGLVGGAMYLRERNKLASIDDNRYLEKVAGFKGILSSIGKSFSKEAPSLMSKADTANTEVWKKLMKDQAAKTKLDKSKLEALKNIPTVQPTSGVGEAAMRASKKNTADIMQGKGKAMFTIG